MEEQHTKHLTYKMAYHFVWCPKYRKQVLVGDVAWAGRTLIKVPPKFTSQVCSGCGQVRKKDLSERWHSCECGTELDRDINAAINILERGRRQQGAISVEAPCL